MEIEHFAAIVNVSLLVSVTIMVLKVIDSLEKILREVKYCHFVFGREIANLASRLPQEKKAAIEEEENEEEDDEEEEKEKEDEKEKVEENENEKDQKHNKEQVMPTYEMWNAINKRLEAIKINRLPDSLTFRLGDGQYHAYFAQDGKKNVTLNIEDTQDNVSFWFAYEPLSCSLAIELDGERETNEIETAGSYYNHLQKIIPLLETLPLATDSGGETTKGEGILNSPKDESSTVAKDQDKVPE